MDRRYNYKLIAVITGVLLLIFLVVVFFINRENPLILESTSPVQYDNKAPQDVEIVFYFNKSLDVNQPENMQVKVAPRIDFKTEIAQNALLLRYSETLIDQTTYNISISNIRASDGTLLELVSNTFTVIDNSVRGEFLRSLPISGDGYTVARLSNDTIYAQITERPVEEKTAEVYTLLEQNGISTDDFVIKIEALRSLTGAGAPAEPTQPLPAGE